MSCDVTVRVLNGRDNTTTLVLGTRVGRTVTPWDWDDVLRLTLEFTDGEDALQVIDSLVDTEAFTTAAGGELTLDLGDLDLPEGSWEAGLFVYTADSPNGTLLDDGAQGYTMLLEVVG